ncbi:MAG: hypothetical protein HY368_03150 [Candidatus Aenigmarchaeota archaeon]|nr:hypothetical protein [Candidatus Aenigmarchaeota archaeon]
MKRECGWYMMKLLIYFGKAGRATEILLQDINSPRRESGTVKLLGDLREKRALPTLMRLLETENTGQLEDTFYAIRRIAERMRAENPDPEYKAWSRSVMEKMFQAITKRGYYEDPFGNNAFEAVRDFSLIANASNYAALAMKELLTERSYSWLPESRFVYLVILGGNSGQKRQLLRFLAGSWRRSGTLESREIAGYLYVLAKNGDRKLQTDVAAMFYSTVIGGVADCFKRDVSLHRLQNMAERISPRFREDWNKAIKSRAGCFRI